MTTQDEFEETYDDLSGRFINFIKEYGPSKGTVLDARVTQDDLSGDAITRKVLDRCVEEGRLSVSYIGVMNPERLSAQIYSVPEKS